jgi:hypothetical protein
MRIVKSEFIPFTSSHSLLKWSQITAIWLGAISVWVRSWVGLSFNLRASCLYLCLIESKVQGIVVFLSWITLVLTLFLLCGRVNQFD